MTAKTAKNNPKREIILWSVAIVGWLAFFGHFGGQPSPPPTPANFPPQGVTLQDAAARNPNLADHLGAKREEADSGPKLSAERFISPPDTPIFVRWLAGS